VSEPRIFTTGPTALHPLVRREMPLALEEGLGSESHRSGRFRAEVARTGEALRALLGVPDDHRILFVSSASEAMERIVEGVVDRRSFHFVSGAFARRMRTIAGALGRAPEGAERPDGEGFRMEEALEAVEGALAGGSEPVDLVCLTQNETSTGVRIGPDTVHGVARRARQAGALTAVDLVSGWPTEEVDPARIDAGFFSVQKGFGLPAGLGVIIASPALLERARERQGRGRSVGGYMHLPALADAADRNQTVATPNALTIRLLGRVAENYLARGVETLRREAEAKRTLLMEAVAASESLRPFVRDGGIRSRTILVLETDATVDDGAPTAHLRERLLEHGFVTSDGYGSWKGRHLRIANFPVQSAPMAMALARVLRTL
jgi:phosphoserine aminotransferase